MRSIKVGDFDLKSTVECGQFFRWNLIEGHYYINSRDSIIKCRQEKDELFFEGVSEVFVRRFFRLDDDLKTITRSINKDKLIGEAIREYYGLRLLRQDPWECLISYICSAAANIPKIKMNVDKLSEHFGRPVSCDCYDSHHFPHPGRIDDLKKISACKVGFRAGYIHNANKVATENFFIKLKSLPYAEAKKELIKLEGVGEKIADCILLFSLEHMDAFPIDTWIRKVMIKHYFKGRKISDAKIRDFAASYFGKYAGYAQQYLYYYSRLNNV